LESSVLKGDRREQTRLRLKERLSVDWGNIIEAITEVWGQQWEALAISRGNGAYRQPSFGAAVCPLRVEGNGLACGFEYPAVNAAIARFEKRLKTDRDLQKNFKKIAKKLKIEI
jgi:hypothetical protein